MKPNKENSQIAKDTLSEMDILCSSGYLAPRSEEDIQRFDRIYADCEFETEKHYVDANAIFDKVMHGGNINHIGAKVANISHASYNYLVASSLEEDENMMCAEDIMDYLKKKKKD